ncbi:MAG: FecR family protein [Flavobacteriaceae bacterium]
MKNRDIDRYLQQKGGKQLQDQLYKWLIKNPKNKAHFSLRKAKHVMQEMQQSTVADNELRPLIRPSKKRKNVLYSAIAAAMILLIWLNVIREPTSYIEVQAQMGDRHHVMLPDSSQVYLNAGSRLRYSKDFGTETRSVHLVGEAIFEVYHNPDKPFTVQTAKLKVQVLGTRFNLRAYPQDKTVETTLIHGKVEVYPNKALPVELKPAQKAVFDIQTKKISVEEVITDHEEAWRHGRMIFKRTPLEQVIGDFERYYNKNIQIKSQHLYAYEYTGSFDNLNFEDAMRLLSLSSPIRWTEVNGIIWIEQAEH